MPTRRKAARKTSYRYCGNANLTAVIILVASVREFYETEANFENATLARDGRRRLDFLICEGNEGRKKRKNTVLDRPTIDQNEQT